jgi:glycosyltransferase involved in cell wall biosynthesis
MCTYNAVHFVDEQLESFLSQEQLPAELVVQDDGSIDGTVQRVEAFAQRAPFPVRLAINETRLGPTGNFERAMGRTTGEIVLLSDADDWWHPARIAAVVRAFVARPQLGCVLSDAELVDGVGRPKGQTLWQSIGFGPMSQYRFEHGDVEYALLKRTIGFGGTMALHRRVLNVALPIPRPWGHDNWSLNVAAALFDVAILPRALMSYRQHGSQYSGTAKLGVLERLRKEKERKPVRDWVPSGVSYSSLIDRLEKSQDLAQDRDRLTRYLHSLRLKEAHQLSRERLSDSAWARLAPIAIELIGGRYSRFSNGLPSAIRDLLLGAHTT